VEVKPATKQPKDTVVSILNRLIEHAGGMGASDIHIDPLPDSIGIKLRIDGQLQDFKSLPKYIHQELIGRIKVLARLRTDEHYAAQDGRFSYSSQDKKLDYDIRVSILPSYYGENAVLRLLRKNASSYSLIDLGFSETDQLKLEKVIKKKSGMIIITGPTGSGKTTTLYSLINLLSKERLVVTIEDPVEYAMSGVRQIQTGSQAGLTFANGLKAVLRQDPDVIMVGEIRDSETAHIATHATLTGHLLLTTMHTADAPSVIPRLFDLNIDTYLVASTLDIVIAQRLVRKICPECKKQGCSFCFNTGFRGRTGIYEIMEINDVLKTAIHDRSSGQAIKKLALESGLKTMHDDGLAKCELGIIDKYEVESILS
jgi:general secretion pathway protein E